MDMLEMDKKNPLQITITLTRDNATGHKCKPVAKDPNYGDITQGGAQCFTTARNTLMAIITSNIIKLVVSQGLSVMN